MVYRVPSCPRLILLGTGPQVETCSLAYQKALYSQLVNILATAMKPCGILFSFLLGTFISVVSPFEPMDLKLEDETCHQTVTLAATQPVCIIGFSANLPKQISTSCPRILPKTGSQARKSGYKNVVYFTNWLVTGWDCFLS
jgi:hypothetical protein